MKAKNQNRIAGIILAGGESKRMGRPKPLIDVGGKTFSQIIVEKLKSAGLRDISIVLGSDAENIKKDLNIKNIKTIINSNWRGGQISSLKAALKNVSSDTEALVVCLIDHPGVSVTTIDSIISEYLLGGNDIVIPVYAGRGGHPVVFGRRVFNDLMAASEKSGAREVVRSGKFRVARISLDDPFIRQDLDTPDDYSKAQFKI